MEHSKDKRSKLALTSVDMWTCSRPPPVCDREARFKGIAVKKNTWFFNVLGSGLIIKWRLHEGEADWHDGNVGR